MSQSSDHKVNVFICENKILFLQLYDGPLLPHMKLLLKCKQNRAIRSHNAEEDAVR